MKISADVNNNTFASSFESTARKFQNIAKLIDDRNKTLEAQRKTRTKRKKGSIIVNGSTSKEQIRKYKVALRRKIAEIAMDKEMEKTVRLASINLLEQKLSDLDALLKNIDKASKESIVTKKHKKAKGKVVLHDDELNLKDDNRNSTADKVSSDTVSGFEAVSPMTEVTSSLGAAETQNIDAMV